MMNLEALLGQIEVEIDGLKSVAAAMRSELDGGLRSQTSQVTEVLESGASVGGPLVGTEFVDLQNKVHAWMQGTVDALYNVDLGTTAVAQAAETIARLYGDSDGFARMKASAVTGLLPQSSTAAAGQPSPVGDPRG